jgi:hypothetical protein
VYIGTGRIVYSRPFTSSRWAGRIEPGSRHLRDPTGISGGNDAFFVAAMHKLACTVFRVIFCGSVRFIG